ncbi:MAG: hypothetical protein OXF56_12715 [Rhodobacteraceae bacterium]|nr:hypothetical protein [Paracoccaceae bacterium]
MNAIEIFARIGRDKLTMQEETNRELITKASIALGFGGIVIATSADLIEREIPVFLVAGLFASFVMVACCCIFILTSRRWYNGPRLDELEEIAVNNNENFDVTLWVGQHYRNAVEFNNAILRSKNFAFRVAAVALVSQFTFLLSLLTFEILSSFST